MLVVSIHLQKYARQIGSSPRGRGENQQYLSCHHLVLLYIEIVQKK